MASFAARLAAGLQQLVDQLDAAGVPATSQPGQVNPPGAWLSPRTAEEFTLDGSAQVRVNVHLIVGDSSDPWPALAALLDKALTVIDPDEPVDLAFPIILPHTAQPLPGVRLAVDIIV